MCGECVWCGSAPAAQARRSGVIENEADAAAALAARTRKLAEDLVQGDGTPRPLARTRARVLPAVAVALLHLLRSAA